MMPVGIDSSSAAGQVAESKTPLESKRSLGAPSTAITEANKGCCSILCGMLARLCCGKKASAVEAHRRLSSSERESTHPIISPRLSSGGHQRSKTPEYPEGLTVSNLYRDPVGRAFAKDVCTAGQQFDLWLAFSLSWIYLQLNDPNGSVDVTEIAAICNDIENFTQGARLRSLCVQIRAILDSSALRDRDQVKGLIKQLLFDACIPEGSPFMVNPTVFKCHLPNLTPDDLELHQISELHSRASRGLNFPVFKKSYGDHTLAMNRFNLLPAAKQQHLIDLTSAKSN